MGLVLKVIIFKESAQKRYDWIAQSALDAAEIVEETLKAMKPYQLRNLQDGV